MDRTEEVHLRLPPAALVAAALAALVLVGMLATLVAVLVSLEGTRSEIRTTRRGVLDTDAHLRRVTGQLDPVLTAAAPITAASSTRALRRDGRSVVTAAGRVPALGDDARRAADAAGYIGESLGDAQLAPTLTALRGLAGDATAGQRLVLALDGAARVLPVATRVLSALDTPGPRSLAACEARLRARAPSQPGQVGCLLRFVPEIRGLLVDLRQLNRTSTQIQRATLAQLQSSLAIQRETLTHVRSIDDKTAGPVPAAAPGG